MALPLRGLTRDARRAKDIRRLDMRQFVLSSYVSGLMSYCLLVLLVSCLLSCKLSFQPEPRTARMQPLLVGAGRGFGAFLFRFLFPLH